MTAPSSQIPGPTWRLPLLGLVGPGLLLSGCGEEEDAEVEDSGVTIGECEDGYGLPTEPLEISSTWDVLPRHAIPLFGVGDLNEDGEVDEVDADLLLQAMESDTPLEEIEGVTCAAAGDLDLDGEITGEDMTLLLDWLAEGGVAAPALWSNPYGSCGYHDLKVAVAPDWLDDSTTLIFPLGVNLPDIEIPVDGVDEGDVWTEPGDYDSSIKVQISPEKKEDAEPIPLVLNYEDGSSYVFTLKVVDDTPPKVPADGDDSVTVPEEEAQDGVCPQADLPCQALVVDFFAHEKGRVDAPRIRDMLEEVGCEVEYIAPEFKRVPQTYYFPVKDLPGEFFVFEPDPSEVATAEQANRNAWAEVDAGIARYGKRLEGGASAAVQLYNAHGVVGEDCGVWVPGVDTGKALSRDLTHALVYKAAKGRVCDSLALDWSCFGGLTPWAVDQLNSGATPDCKTQQTSHDHHASYDRYWALSPTSVDAELQESRVEHEELALLAGLGFRALDEGVSGGITSYREGIEISAQTLYYASYRDFGYPKGGDPECEDGLHESAY